MVSNFFQGNRRQLYLSVSGRIVQIQSTANSRGEGSGCTQMMTIEDEEGGITNFFINENTCIADGVTLRENMQVTAFYNANLPAPLIYPPQFIAAVVVSERQGRMVTVNFFDQNLLAADRSLKLNLSSDTEVVTCNNQTFRGNPGGHVLAVLYSRTTRSLPPQTTPEKIIVLCGA